MKKISASLLLLVILVFVVMAIKYNQSVGFSANAVYMETDFLVEKNSYVENPNKSLETYNIIIPSRFQEVANNGSLALYFEPETLAIAVKVLDNGYVYSSYNLTDSFTGKSAGVVNPIKSGVTLDLYKDTTPVSIAYMDSPRVLAGENQPAAISSIETTDNGIIISVDYNHPEIKIRFKIEIELNEKTISYTVPFDSIEEYNPNNFDNTKQYYLLRNIILFPYFGSVTSKSDGYVVIPDGSGALVSLTPNPATRTSWSASVYGSDRGYETLTRSERVRSVKENERLSLPVYGVIHDANNTGYLAYIEEGAPYADVNFKSAGIINDYYYTYFSFRYRRTYEQYQSRSNEEQYRISFTPEKHSYNLKQSFVFLTGEDADYVGMAKTYRDILVEKEWLKTQNRKDYEQVPLSIGIIGSDITQGIIQNKALKVTTYNQTKELVDRLIQDGYESLLLTLSTYNMSTDQYEFSRTNTMGSRNELSDLLQYLNENNVEFSQYYDYVKYYGSKMNYLAQSLSRREVSYRQVSYMFNTHQVVRPSLYQGMVSSDLKNLNKYGISSISLGEFDKAIFTGFDSTMVLRTQNVEDIRNALEIYKDNQMTMNIYQPDDYLYSYVSSYLGAPLSSSNYKFVSATIPFVQLVLAGYVDMFSKDINSMSDVENMLLRMVEFGVYPSVTLTNQSAYVLKKSNMSSVYISEYDVLTNRISNYYEFISPGLEKTIGQTMVDHQYIAQGVAKVTYQNGTIIVINYNLTDYDYGSITVSPSSYRVIL